MLRSKLNELLQNKNAVMFIAAIIFMSGILGFFNDNALLLSGIYTLIAIILVLKRIISVKYILILLALFYLGFFNTYFRIKVSDDLVTYAPGKVSVKGQIVSIPNSGDKIKTKFFLKVNEVNEKPVSGKTYVTVGGEDFSDFQIGNFYEIKGSIKVPFKAGNPSQFDYGKYLRNFDSYTVFYANKEDCKVIQERLTFKWRFLQQLNILRSRIVSVHSKYIASPQSEILGGIVFGDDAVAPPDYIKASFVNSGLLHILAASGMNVAFIYGFWFFIFIRLRVPYRLTVISGIFVVILYTLMTGLGASVIRAALMLIFVLIGKLIDRDAQSISLLAFVAMLMLVYNPAFINDVGFQLSFIVTFGILTTANAIFEKFQTSKITSYVANAILIPIVAQIWVAPIQMFYFNTFSSYSIFANVLSFPFLAVVSFGGFISSIIAGFSPYTDKICMYMDLILNYFLQAIVLISNYFSGLKHSILTTTHPSIFQIFYYYGIVLLVTLSIKLDKKILPGCFVFIFLLLISFINIPSNELEVITFDVQNADCFLIKTPQNKYFIIDTGRAAFRGGKAQANSIIIKYLKDRGIKNIEGMIITHFDNDHSGGAVDIMNNVNINHVYINSYTNNSMTSNNIYEAIKTKNISAEIPKGIIYKEPNLQINTYISDENSDNEQSIISLLTYKDFDMLFMGDAGVKAFDSIKQNIPNNVEVLKVGHHGGNGVVNKEMLEHMNTKVSIISTGPNAFGHPTRGTIDTLRNTQIYRTDRHNSIKIKSNGEKYDVFVFSPDKHKYVLSQNFSSNVF